MKLEEVNDLAAEEKLFSQRVQQVLEDQKNGKEVYVYKFEVKDSIDEILRKSSELNPGQFSEEKVQSAGRVIVIRNLSNFTFYKISSEDLFIQLVIDASKKDPIMLNYINSVKRGDLIGYLGNPGKTKTGELSVKIKEIKILTPCLRTIPSEYFGIKDLELKYRKRFLDLIINPESRMRFKCRSKIIYFVREYLNTLNFLEVETPMMNKICGGAAAKPFITYHNELKMELFMRISPELYLKQLVVGGLERVFEIGKQFRNEGIDTTHNPEFTSCEFYMAYADYFDLIKLTEDMISKLAYKICGKYKIIYHNKDCPIEINFEPPFLKIDILDQLNEKLNLSLTGLDFEKEEVLENLINICNSNNITVSEPKTMSRVLDKLIGHYIEPMCVNPTFLIGHPLIMSPLAKTDRNRPGITERFELFINKKEIVNAYTELNDPIDQRMRFNKQAIDKAAGDEEAMVLDEVFVNALEYGLPPTGGWGLGIDRLVMLLTDAQSIRDVIFFPAMKPEENLKENK